MQVNCREKLLLVTARFRILLTPSCLLLTPLVPTLTTPCGSRLREELLHLRLLCTAAQPEATTQQTTFTLKQTSKEATPGLQERTSPQAAFAQKLPFGKQSTNSLHKMFSLT